MKLWAYVVAALIAGALFRRRRHLEPPMLVGGVLAIVLLAVYGTGAVHLPTLEEVLTHVGSTLGAWTYLLVAVFAFLETGAFIGLIAPGETAMIVGGVVAGQGEISVITLIAITWFAAVLGDCASYELGRRLGRDFLVRHGSRFQITPERLERVETFFQAHGGKAIFIGRFVGLVRAVAPFLAGSGRMPFRRFLPYDVLGAGLWSTTFILIGYVFWQSFDQVLKIAKQGAIGLGVAISVVVGIVLLVRVLADDERRHALEARIMAALDRPGLRVLQPVVRWAKGPARFFIQRLTPGQLGLELTALLAVVAVGSFGYIGNWLVIRSRGYGSLDATVHRWAVDLADATATDIARVLTWLGSPWIMETLCVLVAIALLTRRRVLEAVVVAGGMALTTGLVVLTKGLVDRPRPSDALVEAGTSSFPSGHAAYAMAWVVLAIVAVRVVPALRGRWWLVVAGILVALVVGLTRLYLRAHWAADVFGGWGVAAMSFSIVAIVALIVAFVRQNGSAGSPPP
ncbi:unannotated protein [freshwater metagenome]|uniref:Unannotated protein n=1 Tax=freshwater metagenome TaxID=449393 RepID=A0A6J7IQ99_9ZZZZ|nr:phosphatase PAP2 family protein [Actinomycetota bacterium]